MGEQDAHPAAAARRALRAARERTQDQPPARPADPAQERPRRRLEGSAQEEMLTRRQAAPGEREHGRALERERDGARGQEQEGPRARPASPARERSVEQPRGLARNPGAESAQDRPQDPRAERPQEHPVEDPSPEEAGERSASRPPRPGDAARAALRRATDASRTGGDAEPDAPAAADGSRASRTTAGARPGDIAREALRAARAQARQEADRAGRPGEETARRTLRAGARPAPARPTPARTRDAVADERARHVRTFLAGAFRMPPEGTTARDEPAADGLAADGIAADGLAADEPMGDEPGPLGTGTPGRADPETRGAGSPSLAGADPVPEPQPTPTRTPGPESPVGVEAVSGPEATSGPEPTSGPEATRSPGPTPGPDSLPRPEGTPGPESRPTRTPVPTMAAPSRDGDHRRTFPRLPAGAGGEDGGFARTWWGNAWITALEQGALDAKRLARGRSYAERGHVDAITVTPGLVLAYVQGSRPRPYRVQVRLRTLSDEDWERFLDAAVERPGHIAALLDKEMPESLAECGVPLLPGPGDLEPHCSCPDRGHPCKHAAALCYQTARLLDADPFVLLLLRGRGERELLDALSRRNAARAARAAREQEPGSLPGVRASEALAPDRRLPPLPPPAPVPPHPGQPPAYPAVPDGPDSFALDQLATDAAARAHALLTTGQDETGALTLWQDAVRIAASRPGSGLTAATRALYASLASAAGRTPADLARAVAAWRQGGPDGLAVLEEPWDPPAGRFDRARPLLLAADLPAFRPWRNHLTHPRGHVQLRFGRDGLWYPYESEPGHDDWWPRGTPDSDPVGALTGLDGADDDVESGTL